jgi:hypothetical protein
VGAVYADAMTCEPEKRVLLCVGECEGLQPSKDYGVVGYNDRDVVIDSFVGDGARKVDGEEDSV